MLFIPDYLLSKELPKGNYNLLGFMSSKYKWTKFKDITEAELAKVYKENYEDFWTLIKHLTFQGVIFSGKLNRFNIERGVDDKRLLYFQDFRDEEIDYQFTFAFLKLRLIQYGIVKKSDLHLVPIGHVVTDSMNKEAVEKLLKKENFSIGVFPEKETHFTYEENKSNFELSTKEKNKLYKSNESISKTLDKNTYTFLEEKFVIKDEMLEKPIKPGLFTATNLLEKLSIHYKFIKDLPSNLDFILDFSGVGYKKTKIFLQEISSNNLKLDEEDYYESKVNRKSSRKIKKSHTPTIREKEYFVFLDEEIVCHSQEFLDYSIHRLNVIEKIKILLSRSGIKKVGEIPFNIEEFLKRNKVKKVERYNFCIQLFNIMKIEELEAMFTSAIDRIIKNNKPIYIHERAWNILLMRLLEGKTLEQIGSSFVITRERVRQIIKKNTNLIFERYSSYFNFMKEKIKSASFVHIRDLVPLRDEFETELLINIFKELKFVNIHDQYLSLLPYEELVSVLQEFYSKISNGKDVFYKYSLDELKKYIEEYYSEKVLVTESSFVLKDLLSKSFERSNNNQDYYLFKQKLNKAELCQVVFEKEFADGLHVYKNKDVLVNKIKSYYPNEFNGDSDRSIIANLTRDDKKIILWDIGYFKHIKAINSNINENTLAPIKDWLTTQFDNGVKQINTAVAFEHFSETLKELGIDSEHALYSLLKVFHSDSFEYSRSPTLILKGETRKGKHELIEDYLIREGKEVSKKELYKYFIEKLGWRSYMIEQNLNLSDRVYKTGKGFIHRNNLNVTKENLNKVYVYAKNKMNQINASYSVDVLFNERKSFFLQMGIIDSRVLYTLLEKNFSDQFVFYRYPLIHPKGNYEDNELSTYGQFESFLLETDNTYTRSELKDQFIRERGWKESTFNMVFSNSRNKVVEVFKDEYVHVKFVGWNNEKQKNFKKAVEQYLINSGEPFLHIERQLLSVDEFLNTLPELNVDYDWTIELFISFAERLPNINLLGNKKAVITSIKNPNQVQDEHELITYLLKNKYDGYVKVGELVKYLYNFDLCGGSLPKSYIQSNVKTLDYSEKNGEIILNELLVK